MRRHGVVVFLAIVAGVLLALTATATATVGLNFTWDKKPPGPTGILSEFNALLTSSNRERMTAHATDNNGNGNSWCTSSIWDWKSSEHSDGRIVRNCHNGSRHGRTVTESTANSANISEEVHKLGACRYRWYNQSYHVGQTANASHKNCAEHPNADISAEITVPAHSHVDADFWLFWTDGCLYKYFDGSFISKTC